MLIILTGLPATGKTTAKQFLLDMGYLSIDNIGIDIVQRTIEYRHLFDANHNKQLYVIGLAEENDPLQTCDFIEKIRTQIGKVDVLYFDADEETMYRRIIAGQYNTEQSFSSTPSLMMLAERRQLNQPIRAIADLVIDSGAVSIAQMRLMLIERYSGDAFIQQKIVIEIVTFSYACGMIRDANLVLDLRSTEHSAPEAAAVYGEELFAH